MNGKDIVTGAFIRVRKIDGTGWHDPLYVREIRDGYVTFAKTRHTRARWHLPYQHVVKHGELVRRPEPCR